MIRRNTVIGTELKALARKRFRNQLDRIRLTTTCAQTIENEERSPDPYGIEYGSGPSRIPYDHRGQFSATVISNPSLAGIQHQRQDQHRKTKTEPYTYAEKHEEKLRKALRSLSQGSYATFETFANSIPLSAVQVVSEEEPTDGQSIRRATKKLGPKGFAKISRYQQHITLHHLIRMEKWRLATQLVTHCVQDVTNSDRRSIIREPSLQAFAEILGDPSRQRTFWARGKARSNEGRRYVDIANTTGIIQSSMTPSAQLHSLLELLSALQKVRHRRPVLIYDVIIAQCCAEKLPDTAAKIFVGLVEEWITEGRLAESESEGVVLDDFYRGGGPPRESFPSSGRGTEMKSLSKWFKGVRTWCLPGETLSPHDRLDLWHPNHLSLKEKLRNFPLFIPTSPPSIVPAPTVKLLKTILQSLRVDPNLTPFPVFEASVRAAAILANTVLSRTLPMGALPMLLTTFRSIPSHPPVYPESMVDIPQNDPQAYTAYTQVHCALLSLLFSPPSYTYSAAMKEYESTHPPTAFFKPEAERYVFPPLEWKSANLLLQYGLRAVRKPELIQRLVTYCKEMFGMGGQDPRTWNIALRGETLARRKELAKEAEEALFKQPLSETKKLAADPRAAGPRSDQTSVISLLSYLTATSQFERVETLIYTLIPFLDSRNNPSVSVAYSTGISRSPPPESLSSAMYGAILNALEKSGRTNLASRVFNLAEQAERRWAGEHRQRLQEQGTNLPIPVSLRLSIPLSSSMLAVYAQEIRNLWMKSKCDDRLSRLDKARNAELKQLADRVYLRAYDRWDELIRLEADGISKITDDEINAFMPDERFFNAYIEVNKDDWSGRSKIYREYKNKAIIRLKMVITDIENSALPVPSGLRLAYKNVSVPPDLDSVTLGCSKNQSEGVEESDRRPDHERDHQVGYESTHEDRQDSDPRHDFRNVAENGAWSFKLEVKRTKGLGARGIAAARMARQHVLALRGRDHRIQERTISVDGNGHGDVIERNTV